MWPLSSNPKTWLRLVLCWLFIAHAPSGIASEEGVRVTVADPFIELHTGPGRGFPVFYVAERGSEIELLQRRTDWFRVRTASGREGWVPSLQLARTLTPAGEPVDIKAPTRDDFTLRTWEFGAMAGDFEGASLLNLYGAYHFNPNLSAELSLSQASGDFSTSWLADARLVAQPVPEWRISPYFAVGGGIIQVDPSTTIIASPDRTDNTAHASVGLRSYLTRRFLLRLEYSRYVIFQGIDENAEIDEWTLGFGVFF
jgi:hypothetical protein